ncbi:MAG TPA: DUF6531 domain-containing protein, partial [Candidatus Polarisedimenticolia bacterium]|nr:DUF6531 domain-containing protein [Candidatus Polarisedimenticolia bacterium]
MRAFRIGNDSGTSMLMLLAALAACLLLPGALWAHDFGGPTGPGGPPPGDGCPGCCGGGGGGGPCGGPSCGAPGDPVNTWDGSERHTTLDVNLPGHMPIRFERIYDSRVDYDSPLGYGWAHSYDMRVYRYPDGAVMLRRTCGGRRLFTPSGGAYISPAGEFRNTLLEDGDGTLTLLESSGMEYAFDLKGRLESIQDVFGNRLEMSYDPAGRLPLTGTSKFTRDPNAPGIVALDYRLTQVRERNALGALTGRSITLAYNGASGRLQSVSDSNGRTWNYTQDADGNLTGVSGPAGLAYTYAYNDADPHNLTGLTEPPSAFTLVYDAQDRVTKQTMNSGTVFDFTYNVAGIRTTVVETVKDAVGGTLRTATTVYEFNSYGNPTKMTDALGDEFEYLRDGTGNTMTRTIKQFVTGTGLVLLKTVTYGYDAAGNLTSEAHANAATGETVTKTFTYDHNLIATTRISSSLNPTMVHGSDIVYAHNARGYPTTVTQEKRIVSGGNTPTPTFFTIGYSYDSFGNRLLATYPNGDTDTFSYTNGVLTGLNGETLTRDGRGNLLTRVDRNSNTWIYTYDDLDRVLTVHDPAGADTILTYTGPVLTQMEVGKTASTAGRIHVMTYDAAGRVLTVKRQTPGGLVTMQSYTRDSEGKPLTQTDGAGRTITTTIDLMGRPATIQFGAGGAITQQYDAFGNLTRAVDGAGRVTRFTNWLVEQPSKPLTVTNGLNKTYTAVLYADGNLRTLTDPIGRVLTEVHDALGRLTSFSGPSGVPTQYSYGGRSAVASRTDALGGITTYTYNVRGAMTGI